jgi:hypothetical protein
MAYSEIYTNGDVLQPFEVPLSEAASLVEQSIHERQEGITAAKIRAALVRAIRQGEIKLKRGTLETYDWPTLEPIVDLREVRAWALASGLRLFTGGAGCLDESLDVESHIETDLYWTRIDRLRALRAMQDAGIDPDEPDAASAEDDPSSPSTRLELAKALTEIERLKRELAAERKETDPRHRKTLLRIIAALLETAKGELPPEGQAGRRLQSVPLHDLPPKTAARAINIQLEKMGQKAMDEKTPMQVIADARSLANELID